jgi:phage shock protein PspC (stress-responsive transcriptional regulator)
MMQTSQPSLIARDHTLLGVCEAIGEDFGFNPIFLRVPLAALLLLNPAAVIGTYLALGVLVLLTRWISPNPRPAAATRPAVAAGPAPAANEVAEDLAVAA